MLRLLIGCIVGLTTALTIGWVGGQALVAAKPFSSNRPVSVLVRPPASQPAPMVDIPVVPSPAGVPDEPVPWHIDGGSAEGYHYRHSIEQTPDPSQAAARSPR